ncbi:polysaccharide lyase family 7 protein [Vibrio sp. CK2-1]|uniref:polysaccharide lyase family 7 protein n=1 Tax=Vibrio sp. CK2-1 TaxID=2912249 RepID=UPI001F3C6E65|nr:polysaccharide lyase family 7 protein [Vibrio sp. CK2-1]MCF7352814.1 polysaccharide lyase family 7 protein [Vibrio sp. CK2-1]
MKKRFLLIPTLLAASSIASANVQFSNPNDALGEPADYPQFSNILAASELQISDPEGKKSNKEFFATDNDYTGIVNQNFYVDKATEAFVFKMKNDHLRNELRVQKNFRTDLADEFYKLSAEVQIINPDAAMKNSNSKQNEITFLQVHNKGLDNSGTHNVPHPLLRVVWKENNKGVKGHFWAVTKNNAVICKGSAGAKNKDKEVCQHDVAYTMVDLGTAPSDKMTKFDVTVGNKTLAIDVNGERKLEKDIDYWRHLLSFFKAGVYNQFTNGQSEAHFKSLEYTEIKK